MAWNLPIAPLNLKVIDARPIQPGQIEKVAGINGTGKLVKKPVEFCSKSDIREEYRPMMYLPGYTEMNDYVYVSGYDKQQEGIKTDLQGTEHQS